MKILIIMGSPRLGETQKAVNYISQRLKKSGSFEIDLINLKDLNIKPCIGCFTCLTGKGENKCPLKDDRDIILEKMMEADGLIMAVPNYSLQVPALTKNLLDRLAFVFHRPRMHGKKFMAVVTQGVYGGGGVVKYLNEAMRFWGFDTCKGVCITTIPGQKSPAEQEKIDNAFDKAVDRFEKALAKKKVTVPSIKEIAIFHMARTSFKYSKEESIDRNYYQSKGWFNSRYYYDVRIGPFKMIIGWIIDRMIGNMVKKGQENKSKLKDF